MKARFCGPSLLYQKNFFQKKICKCVEKGSKYLRKTSNLKNKGQR